MVSLESQHVKLCLTAAVASVVTFGAMTTYQTVSRRQRRKQLALDASRSASKSTETHILAPGATHSPKSLKTTRAYDEDLIREQLARNYAFFGDERMARVRAGRIVIVGCGGVGSHAALMLARSGVSHIRLIDFDYVTLSSLNRHATALLSDVGTPKVKCVERNIREVAKWVEVDSRVDIWRKEDGGGDLLEGADWVVGKHYAHCSS